MLHQVKYVQWLSCTPDEAWGFFSRPENLQQITPPELDFKILTSLPKSIYPGLLIEYKIKLFKFVRMNWLTEITHAETDNYFVDEQLKGPYAYWHHEHHFAPFDEGTLMTDILFYRLPFGWFGDLFHDLLIKPQLEKIFGHRKKVLNLMFDSKPLSISL